ncbi:MAG TPA: PD-(D/E)XK nuclease family protein [Candidatus Nanopelagicales bacterium]|nr:PD-(D/E)XK nuclease family protein [Candidatus Nanopelagicales bacterium]
MTEQQDGTTAATTLEVVDPAQAWETGPSMSLSPSRASDFMTCPLLYRFRVVDRIPEKPSREAVRGTVVHQVLEDLFDLPADQRTVETATSMLPTAWETVREQDEALVTELFDSPDEAQEWLASAVPLLETYFRLEDPAVLEPAERELRVETALDNGLVLRGYVDRLDRNAAGDTRVVDYKTGRAPGEGYEQKALFQMRFYALVLWRATGTVPRLLQLLYLGNEQILRYEPDEDDLRATERKVSALWEAIQRAHETGDWRPSPSRLCDWCDHKSRCPSFGGTPPPLPTAPA